MQSYCLQELQKHNKLYAKLCHFFQNLTLFLCSTGNILDIYYNDVYIYSRKLI